MWFRQTWETSVAADLLGFHKDPIARSFYLFIYLVSSLNLSRS